MVPTYFRRDSGIECFNGLCGFALLFLLILLPSSPSGSAVIPQAPAIRIRNGSAIWFASSVIRGRCYGGTERCMTASAIESRSPRCRSGKARCIERRAARRRGASPRQARAAVRDHAGHGRLRLFADPQRDRSGAVDAQARGSRARRLALPAVMARGKSLAFRAWSPDDRLMLGPLGILEPSPAAAELIPDIMLVPLAAFDAAGAPHRLWRRTLRLHAGAFAQGEGHHGHRHSRLPCSK